MKHLQLRNAQRASAINSPLLREITRCLIEDLLRLDRYELALQIVSARRMAELNHGYLQHEGSTDVITFDYREGYGEASAEPLQLHGEIYISLEDALIQAGQFKTSWPEELVRYIVHGVLHLQGFDDLDSAGRKTMKREENRLLKLLAKKFSLARLAP